MTVLRTHPPTQERVRRLRSLVSRRVDALPRSAEVVSLPAGFLPRNQPRWWW